MTVHEVRVQWQSDMHFEAQCHPDVNVPLDSAPQHGGQEAGARPVDLVLAGLAGCTGMDVLSILRKKRQPVTGLEVQVIGQQRQEHPRVFTDVALRYVVMGEGVQDAAVERSIELSIVSYCPVASMLGDTTSITTSYELRS